MGRLPVSYVGRKFGRLMAIEKIRKAPGPNGLFYMCRCDCGITREYRYCNLKTGNTQSCGCFKREVLHRRKQTDEYLRVSEVGRYYRRNAKERGLLWKLTRKDVAELITRPCRYCGFNASFVGIDRVNNAQGYERTNTVPCSHVQLGEERHDCRTIFDMDKANL
jgi:hypothetical protein